MFGKIAQRNTHLQRVVEHVPQQRLAGMSLLYFIRSHPNALRYRSLIFLINLRRAHALEMGANPDKDPPFYFTKPPDAAVDVSKSGTEIHYPPGTENLHHEVELVVAIGRGNWKAPTGLSLFGFFRNQERAFRIEAASIMNVYLR